MRLIFDSKSVIKELKVLKKQLSSDLINPINRAATASRNRIAKELSGITGADLKNIKKRAGEKGLLAIVKAKTYRGNRLFATIIVSGKKLGIYSLAKGNVQPSGSGSVAKLKSGSIFYAGGFVATVNKKKPHTGLFRKKGRSFTEIKILSNPDLFRERDIGTLEESKVLPDVIKFYDLAVAKRLAKFNKRA